MSTLELNDGLRACIQADWASGLGFLLASEVTRPDPDSIFLAKPRKEVGGCVVEPRNGEDVGGGNFARKNAVCHRMKTHARGAMSSDAAASNEQCDSL